MNLTLAEAKTYRQGGDTEREREGTVVELEMVKGRESLGFAAADQEWQYSMW
jgi:hypothetical protein